MLKRFQGLIEHTGTTLRVGAFMLLCFHGQVGAEKPKLLLFGSAGSEARTVSPALASPLNPGNFLQVDRASNASDITFFADLTPESKSWKLRTKLRGTGDWDADFHSRIDVGELYGSVSLTPWLDLQAGRKIEKWGTGYAWNPTGVVNPRKSPADPNDRRSAYRGVDMAGIDLYVRDWNVTLLAVPEIDWNDRSERIVTGAGWAARAYRLVRGADLSFSASGGEYLPNSQGISFSRVFGDALELHFEAAYFNDSLRYLPQQGGFAPVRRKHVDLLLGANYTFRHNLNLIVEYFHTGRGLTSSEWGVFRDNVRMGQVEMRQGNPIPLLYCNRHYALLEMGNNYTFGRLFWPVRFNKVEVELVALTSLRDGSSLIRPGVYWKIHPNWTLYGLQSEFAGGPATEFGHLQVRRVTDFGIRFHF
jgi:hypothetical protein